MSPTRDSVRPRWTGPSRRAAETAAVRHRAEAAERRGAEAMNQKGEEPGATMALPQGDVGLLRSDVAQRLLNSTVPARLAYVAADGTPRIVPTWFVWTGEELVMATFVAAAHVRHAAARLR